MKNKEKKEHLGLVFINAAEEVLTELCEECDVSEGKVEVVYKSGKDKIRQTFTGPKRFTDALKEVLKYI